MSSILLVNPRRRRRRKTHSRKRARRSARRQTYRRRRRSARRAVMSFAPRRRRRRRSFSMKSIRRRRRRNPSLRNFTGAIVPTVKSGSIGALGAIGNDLLYGYTSQYLPDAMKTGIARHATKALYAVLLGILGNYVMRGRGRDLANGAMTVALYNAAKEQLVTLAPQLPLGDYFSFAPAVGYDYNPALPLSTGVGFYETGSGAGVGEYMENYYN